MENQLSDITKKCISLLKDLIRTTSYSHEENDAAIVVRNFLKDNGIEFHTKQNNTWCFNRHFDSARPTILLNSHIDTVKAVEGWTTDPFIAEEIDGKIIGLGSNDAGGALVSLLAAFMMLYDEEDLKYNLCFAATAEEEISGANGIASLGDITSACTLAIIGEPTGMEMAVSERGLMVIDAEVRGRTGHAARDEGLNAIYLAMEDIAWIRNFEFEREDPAVGKVRMTVTMIESGYQHNVVPDVCKYVIDVRTVNTYTHEEIVDIIDKHTHAGIKPRSLRLRPSSIDRNHVVVATANKLGIPTFGSVTLSDQALLSIPSVKVGPGKSERSHTPGEFILRSEIENGIKTYLQLLKELNR